MELDLQRIHVKMVADAPANLNLDPFLAIFGRWRHDSDHPAQWVDLADYAHMAKGPGIVLIGKQGDFSVNRDDPGLGLLYAGKKDFEGPLGKRIAEAFRRCLGLAESLLAEPEYPAALKVQTGVWEIFINDRLQFPNTSETDRLLREPIQSALDSLFGRDGYSLTRDMDPQRRYACSIRAQEAGELADLLERVNVAVA